MKYFILKTDDHGEIAERNGGVGLRRRERDGGERGGETERETGGEGEGGGERERERDICT